MASASGVAASDVDITDIVEVPLTEISRDAVTKVISPNFKGNRCHMWIQLPELKSLEPFIFTIGTRKI